MKQSKNLGAREEARQEEPGYPNSKNVEARLAPKLRKAEEECKGDAGRNNGLLINDLHRI